MSLIRLDNVYKIYNEGRDNQVNALDGVTLEIQRGEFVAIIGTSGSGKSTMMNILGCLDVPTSGAYYLDGTPISGRSRRELELIRSRKLPLSSRATTSFRSSTPWKTSPFP